MADGVDFVDKYDRPMANTDASEEQLAKNRRIYDSETLNSLAITKKLRDWIAVQEKTITQSQHPSNLVGAASETTSKYTEES